MPEHLAPGVHVEETDARVTPIPGALDRLRRRTHFSECNDS